MNEASEPLRKIHDLLEENPGLHISKIAELLDMKITEVDQYLQLLEKKGIIAIQEIGGYKRYSLKDRKIKTRDQRTIDIRRKIYNLIAQRPGIYLTKIAEILDMSIQLTDYHLLYMERNNEIIAEKNPGEYYRRYYTADSKFKKQDKFILEVLRKEILLKIVLLLLKHNMLRHKEIAENLNISSSRVSYHLNKLIKSDIVDVSSFGHDKGYVLKNKYEITDLLKKYQIHLGVYLSIERFQDMWKDLNIFFFRKSTSDVVETSDL